MSDKSKQAVLVIHGVGEQRPMDTLKNFVKTLWETDKDSHHDHAEFGTFYKPDFVSNNYELRVMTTSQNKNGVLTDFYEYYWAHLMENNTIQHTMAWMKRLLFRWPWNLPKPLIAVWFVLVFLFAIVAYLFSYSLLPESLKIIDISPTILSILGVVLTAIVIPTLNKTAGDAARYLDSNPQNIKMRYDIRNTGIKMLEEIQKRGEYSRITVVGHSLGTVIGYDILSHAWQKYDSSVEDKLGFKELDVLEEYISQNKNIDFNVYQKIQKDLFNKLPREGNNKWLVSDFITLGSPLTYANVLLADSQKDFENKVDERELPTCPPVKEIKKGVEKISYVHKKIRKLHYAAVFAPTRWSNIYFPVKFILIGDIIGGKLSPLFGKGIRDVSVKTKKWFGLVSHTFYWNQDKVSAKKDHISEVRRVINLLDKELE